MLKFFQDIYPLVNVIIAILWGIYVYFTIKTFKEIHRQTELQSDAFLMVTCETANSVAEKVIDKLAEPSKRSHGKWTEIVKTHIPSAIGQDSNLLITLTNKGRSDIISWSIQVSLLINPGQYLSEKFNTSGEAITWTIDSETSQDLIQAEQSIVVLAAKVGAYPEGRFSWKIEYSDMRNKNYDIFSGDRYKTVRNVLAYSMKE